MSSTATSEPRIKQDPPEGGDSVVMPQTVENWLDALTQAVQRLIADDEDSAMFNEAELLAERDSDDGYDPSQSITTGDEAKTEALPDADLFNDPGAESESITN